MNVKRLIALFAIFFFSCELKLPEEPETPAWYLPLTVPLIDTEYGFEGILQDGIITTSAEQYDDCGIDNDCETIDLDGTQGNGQYDLGENYVDENLNGEWDTFGITDSLENMIQMEFDSSLDSIGLNKVEQQLGLQFFKLDLSDIAIAPQVIQESSTYDLGENLPSPLFEPTNIPVNIEIPESDNEFINNIFQSCSDFLPDNEQSLSIPFDLGNFPDPISLATEQINEPIVVEVPLSINTDGIDLGDLGSISIEKIILDESMLWEIEFRNGLPFTVDNLEFNIFKGAIIDNNKFTSLTISSIAPYTTVNGNVQFESYELSLESSLFAEISIQVDSEQIPQDQCSLNICVSDALSINENTGEIIINDNNFTIFNDNNDCSSNCDPCFGEELYVCAADAIDSDGNISGEPTIYQGIDAQTDCGSSCNACLDFSLAVCVADAVDSTGNITGEPTTYQGSNSQNLCENSCSPCLQQNTYVCPVDSNVYDQESNCSNNCFLDCVSVSLFACLTDALDSNGNLDTNLIQTYNSSQECIDSCNPCFLEPIHACSSDAIDDNGNINEEDLDGDGIPDSITIYQSQSECLNQCDPCYNGSVYVCTTDSAVIDDDDSTNPSQFSSNDECLASGCNPCLAENLDGWNIQDDEITFSLSGELLLDTLVVNLEINDTPQTDPILVDFPSFDQIEVREALIDDGTQFDDYGIDGIESTGDFGEQDQIYQNQETLYSNQFILNVDNGFFGSAELNLDFSNIYDEDILYSEKITIPSQSNYLDTFNLSNKIIGSKELGTSLENIEINYDFMIENGEYRIPLTNNILSIGETGYQAEVSNIKLKSISAITEQIDFPQAQSVPLQDIPNGFDDFKLYDIFMDMKIYNQITINTVNATFNLTGKKCPNGFSAADCFDDESIESKNFPFEIVLDSPNRTQENICNYQVGDIAITEIEINKDSQTTKYYCSELDENPYEVITVPFDGEENVSLLDFIYFGPNQMNLVGSVLIDGEGTLRENDNLWGEFSIRAPLAFVFNENWVFIPKDISNLEAMDEEVSNQINNSLVEAVFNAEFTNSSPFGISMSMLISDSTIFPLYLDNLKNLNTRCSNSNYEDQLSCENNSFTWLNYSDSLSDLGVDSVEFQQINNEDNRAYYVEFMKNDINGQDSVLFWIGRIIDVSFIEPELLDQNGFVSTPSISFSSEVLDANRVSWFTANEQRYMVPMITLASTEGNPSSLQTTNYLGVRSFLTLVLDTGVTSNQSKKIVVEEQKQSDNLK